MKAKQQPATSNTSNKEKKKTRLIHQRKILLSLRVLGYLEFLRNRIGKQNT